jgi:superfamily II helicase
MFGASASETAAELEAMAAKAKAAEAEAAALVAQAIAPAETALAESALAESAPAGTATSQETAPAANEVQEAAATEGTEAEQDSAPSVTFQDLGLNSYIVKAISEMGFEKPTPVQARIIPTLLAEEGDVVCLAQTGTGKTAAFGLPSLERIVAHNMERYTQVLVLSPTRELCKQITQDLRNYSKHLHDLQVVDVYGGAGIEPQIKALKKIPHIVVATPGRLLDLIGRKATDLSRVHTLILDEADEMLERVVPEYIGGILWSAVCEASASESGARRSSMNAANKNAEEMIGTLMLQFNRARQAVITQEITEIVSGAQN